MNVKRKCIEQCLKSFYSIVEAMIGAVIRTKFRAILNYGLEHCSEQC